MPIGLIRALFSQPHSFFGGLRARKFRTPATDYASIVTEVVSPPTVNNSRVWIGRKTTHTQFPPNSRQSPTPAFKTIIRIANIVSRQSVGEDLPPSAIAPINATSMITIQKREEFLPRKRRLVTGAKSKRDSRLQ